MSNTPVYTHRTKAGRKARILTTDAIDNDYPVIALILNELGFESVHQYATTLQFYDDQEHHMDLVEYSPWDDVAVDTVILVKNSNHKEYIHRHFAFTRNGRVATWLDGRTSWSVKDWDWDGDEESKVMFWEDAVLPQ